MRINTKKIQDAMKVCVTIQEVSDKTGYTPAQIHNAIYRYPEIRKIYDKRILNRQQKGENQKEIRKKEEEKQAEDFKKKMKELTQELPKASEWKCKKSPKKNNEEWILLLSDFHYGQNVKPIEIGNFAEYNPKKAQERLMYLSQTLQHLTKYHTNPPSVLNIFLLGDMIDSVILRASQLATTEFGLIKQIVGCIDLISDFLASLTGSFETIKCYGVGGNHSRITRNFADSLPQDNFDILIYEMIKDRLAHIKKITIEYPESTHMIVQIQKHRFWLEHGNTLRSWLGLPFYGANREKGNIQSLLNIFSQGIDYVTIGHFHQYANFNDIIMNGSFVGGDGYSIGKLRRMCIPEQTLLGVTKKYGIVWVRPIQLEVKTQLTKPKVYGSWDETGGAK